MSGVHDVALMVGAIDKAYESRDVDAIKRVRAASPRSRAIFDELTRPCECGDRVCGSFAWAREAASK